MNLTIIVAMTKDRVIGKDGRIPWREPEDLRHFKRTTLGHAVIMGRKTFDALGGKPLPGRRNIVVTRNAAKSGTALDSEDTPRPRPGAPRPGAPRPRAPGAGVPSAGGTSASEASDTALDFVGSLEEAVKLCRSRGEEIAFVAGGGQIYEQALPLADEMIVTEITRPDIAGDTYFPTWDRSPWSPTATIRQPTFTITTYVRK